MQEVFAPITLPNTGKLIFVLCRFNKKEEKHYAFAQIIKRKYLMEI